MSLHQRQHPPVISTATTRARQRAATTALLLGAGSAMLAVALLSPLPARAQGAPFGQSTAQGPTGLQRSGDPGMAEAERAVSERRYKEAIERFDKVLASNPRNVQARFERAWALAQIGREDEAVRAFSEIAQEFPELPEPHNNLALIYAKRGDLKRAEAELLLALDARPGFAVGYTNLGDVYRKMAESAYQEALKRNPNDARARSGLALLRSGTSGAATGRSAPARAGAAADTDSTREAPPPLPKPPGPDRPEID